MNRNQQYIVTYRDSEVLEVLKNKCLVTYSSLVVNLVLLDSKLSKSELTDIDGVMSAKESAYRLYSNKS